MAPKSRSGPMRRAIGLIKSRVVSQTQVVNTTLKKEIKTDGDQLNAELVIARLQSSLLSLEEKDNQWLAAMSELPEEGLEDEEAIYGNTAASADGYLAAIADAKEAIALLETILASVKKSVDKNNSSASYETPAKSAKLPKLALPTFDGDRLHWHQFWSIFKANVHEAKLSGVEKLSYLRSQLKSTALGAVEGLSITDENYDVAVSILKKRFERKPEQLIGHLYYQLKRVPISSRRSDDLKKTYDRCESIFRLLKQAGEVIDSNRALVSDVLRKYPAFVVKEVAKHHHITNCSTVSDLQSALWRFIDESSDIQEMLDDLDFGPSPKTEQHVWESSNKSEVERTPSKGTGSNTKTPASWPKSSALSATGQQLSKPTPTNSAPCYFCKGGHFNSQCDKFTTREQRLHQLEELGRCQRCLSSGHNEAQCKTGPSRLRCFYCKTRGDHASPICPTKFSSVSDPKGSPQQGRNPGKLEPKPEPVKSSCTLTLDEQSVLSTATTIVSNPSEQYGEKARILFDSGSHRTYITEDLANRLHATSSVEQTLHIAVFGATRTSSITSKLVTLEVELRDGTSATIEACTTPLITNSQVLPGKLPDSTKRMIDTMKFAMADSLEESSGQPDILIGSDYFWDFISGTRIPTPDGLYMIPSTLGFILGGRYKDELGAAANQPSLLCITERTHVSPIDNISALLCPIVAEKKRPPDIEEFWCLEKIGIAEDPVTIDDDLALQQFNDSVYFADSRYHVQWPWKESKSALPPNYQLALGRLRSLSTRLTVKSGDLRQKYDSVISEQLDLGIIEKVPLAERATPKYPAHYLPHHPIIRTDHATTKMRIVYDASARASKDNLSLNDCLYRGPVILPDLCSILLRFRLYPIAIISDIEKAFLQISLQPSDRDVTRFLWINPSTDDINRETVDVYRFARVPFGVISSPFLLSATVQHHLKQANTTIASQIADDIYVDNLITGVSSPDGASLFYRESKHLFSEASMNLRQWCSNSAAVLDSIPKADHASKRITSVLGIRWDSCSDTLQLRNNWMLYKVCTTKRQVLQAVAAIFDPLGFFQPCTLLAKCFIRKLWSANKAWDESLTTELQSEWVQIHKNIVPIFDIRLPRFIARWDDISSATLVAYSDASMSAYAATVYLRYLRDDGSFETNLIFAKTRLTPKFKTKSQPSLPKLELLGLTIAVRAVQFVRNSMWNKPIAAVIFCDSTCVLGWIQTQKILPVFVNNRIREIRKLTKVQYRHVPSEDNPADLCTRGISGEEIVQKSFWWHGPRWLQSTEGDWPNTPSVDPITDVDLEAVPASSDPTDCPSFLAGEASSNPKTHLLPLNMDPKRYSNLRTLLRVTIYCLKFVKLRLIEQPEVTNAETAAKLDSIFATISSDTAITATEIVATQLFWVRHIQRNHYPDVIEALQKNGKHPMIKQFSLELDASGLIRCSSSRLSFADLDEDAKTPILLPKNSYFTYLIVKQAREKLLHAGVAHTLSHIRQHFWIPHGRQVIRRTINKCRLCRRLKGPPFALPGMPPWPRERVSQAKPFQFTGMDYLGPVNVKLQESTHKMWICLFTCLTVRAVHLEYVLDQTAKSFVDCLSRFISRRGAPEQIISDNAPQFRLAKTLFDKTWQRVFVTPPVCSYLADQNVSWKFTTELAPWQGGVYERLVGVVKNALKAAVGRKLLEFSEFITLITEIEAIVNSRPITFVYSDIKSGYPLRPTDFLAELPTGSPKVDPEVPIEGGEASRLLLRHWKCKQKRLDRLWVQWYDEYLLSMRERSHALHRNRRNALYTFPSTGDVVIVKDADSPRGNWNLARVEEVISGRDGKVRSASVRLPTGHVTRRSIGHLFPLEVPAIYDEETNLDPNRQDALAPMAGEDELFEGFDQAEVDETERVVPLYDTQVPCDDSQTVTGASIDHQKTQLSPGLSVTAVALWF